MDFYVLGELEYTASNWYIQILNGILNEKKTKRFNAIIIDSICELENFSPSANDAILLIGSNSEWLRSIMPTCEKKFNKNIIVLGNFEHRIIGRNYSIVSSDIVANVSKLYSYLKLYNKNKIALYGINPYSASDNFRKNIFLECGGKKEDIFLNNLNLKNCYDNFISSFENYDAVICVNDFCAVSLIRHLKENNKKPIFIVSCGETKLAKIVSPSITNLKTHFSHFANAAMNAYKILQKDLTTSSLQILLESEIVIGESTDNLPHIVPDYISDDKKECWQSETFYQDSEVKEMMAIETLLSSCSDFEFNMIMSLLEGLNYNEIADKYYMSVNGIKYKMKSFFDACNVESKSDFLKLLNKYV